MAERSVLSIVGRALSYTVLIGWTLITVLPLIWMGYSSFKSNEELTRDIYALPRDLFDNYNDEYVVITPQLSVVPDYDTTVDKRERLIIESTTIAPGRRLMVYFLVKEELPAGIASLQPGDKLLLSQLPADMRRRISGRTNWFNYISAFVRGGLGFKFINSVIYSGVSTFLVIFLSLLLGFAISQMPFRKISIVVMGIIGAGILISQHSLLIPLFLMLSAIGLTDTHLGIILVYTAFALPLSVLLITQFMRGLPNSLVESAYMDGASVMQALTRIIAPMCTPVMVTVGIITALGIWNEFLMVLVLASTEVTKSLPVAVYSFSSLTGTQFGWQLAALTIATVPVMVVYFAFQKQLARGVVGGAVKG